MLLRRVGRACSGGAFSSIDKEIGEVEQTKFIKYGPCAKIASWIGGPGV